jgi:hypothetical protein
MVIKYIVEKHGSGARMRRKNKELKVVILNPEEIPRVSMAFTELVLDIYKDEILKEYQRICSEKQSKIK